MTPRIAVCMGTFNRVDQLKECIASLRRAAGALTYKLYIADGGSRDGTIEYLRTQSDVHLIEQGELLGAVRAFNAAYRAAIDDDADYICTFNDDITFLNDGAPELVTAVALLESDESLGSVAFNSDRYRTPEAIADDPFLSAFLPSGPPVTFRFERHHGKVYMNQGITRRAAHMAVSRAQGDPTGRDFWDPRYHTYGADMASGCWIWRLGWSIYEGEELKVCEHMVDDDDVFPGEIGGNDPLRLRNMLQSNANPLQFAAEWGDPSRMEYSREDAMRYGGRLR